VDATFTKELNRQAVFNEKRKNAASQAGSNTRPRTMQYQQQVQQNNVHQQQQQYRTRSQPQRQNAGTNAPVKTNHANNTHGNPMPPAGKSCFKCRDPGRYANVCPRKVFLPAQNNGQR
jgi:hypothetical protein